MLLASALPCSAQAGPGPDSLKVLPYAEFMQQVAATHPVARQAALLPEKARREVRISRGAFDPELKSTLSQKEFHSELYYRYTDHSLQVPMWIGNLKAGFERNSGVHVDPDKLTPPEGLSYIGLDLPVGQGLFFDERRAVLREAQIMQKMADVEKVKMINKLLLQAAKDYWDWNYNYNRFRLYRQSTELARVRRRATVSRSE
ncbi:MAG: TolC family protein, partial [Bacteroidota bacterium]